MDRPNLKDPRYYQICALLVILTYGCVRVGIDFDALRAITTVGCCIATQWFASRVTQVRFDPLSAAITSLSLTLLMRTDSLAIAAFAGVLAIGSKFVVRVRGKHLFNPANFSLVFLMLVSDRVWVSSGQWGTDTLIGIALAVLGFMVLNRVRVFTTSLAFLATFAATLLIRAIYLGDPLAIPLHQLQNGALLIFTFFMISDPRTTPDSTLGRVLFGSTVALVAFVVEFVFYTPAGPIWALALTMPMVPILDRLLPAMRFSWRGNPMSQNSKHTGVTHAF